MQRKIKGVAIKELFLTRNAKSLLALWLLIFVLILGFAITGYFSGQLSGHMFLSFFPAAVLANISIIVSYKGENIRLQVLKGGWFLLCLLILVHAVTVINPRMPESYLGAGIYIIYPMLVISFPLGFLWTYIFGGFSYLIDYLGLSGSLNLGSITFYIVNFILWSGFFVVGFFQWFILLPYLIEKWRRRKSQ